MTCECGAAIGPRAKRCNRCRCRLAQERYRRTEKGKATTARYNGSPTARACNARYRAHSQGVKKANNARRIFIGRTYHGRVQTIAHAAAIQRHIKERLLVLKQRFQNREETEGVHARAVSIETAV
jgi:hypothetical protein